MEKLSQVSKLVGMLVEHQSLFEFLSTEDRQWVIQNPKEAIGLFMQTVQNREAHVVPNLDAIMPKIFRLVVDYNMTLEQMIDAGHYDQKDENIIAKNFRLNSKGVVEFEARYFHLGGVDMEKAVDKIVIADKDHPWSPANIEHLLSLAITFPEEQHKYPIIGLGSIYDLDANTVGYYPPGYCSHFGRNSPWLIWHTSERHLGLLGWSNDDKTGCESAFRFLAVRKVSVT